MNYQNASFESSFGVLSQIPYSSCPEIVFSGRSNVGKSSLINGILNRKALARIGSKPGKTITINFYKVDKIRFVDLPGYGYTNTADKERKRFSEMIDGYFGSGRDIRLVLQLLDMRHSPSEDDLTMLNYLTECSIPFVVILTKSDKLNKTEYNKAILRFEEELSDYSKLGIIPFSCLNSDGLSKIKEAINECLSQKH